MKKCIVIFVFCIVAFLLVWKTPLYASSGDAFQTYLTQFDDYRQKNNDFQIAKNEYQKFKTLSAEAAAVAKTREMLSSRSLLLKDYLLFLREKVNEQNTMTDSEKNLYRTLINNEVSFLENHSQFVNSVETLNDATKASQQLESHYLILQVTIRQIIAGMSLADLTALGNTYNDLAAQAKNLSDQVKPELPLDRQDLLDRWFLQISNKRTIFLQKMDDLQAQKTNLGGKSRNRVQDVDTAFHKLLSDSLLAKQELVEGVSYINELTNLMRYKD